MDFPPKTKGGARFIRIFLSGEGPEPTAGCFRGTSKAQAVAGRKRGEVKPVRRRGETDGKQAKGRPAMGHGVRAVPLPHARCAPPAAQPRKSETQSAATTRASRRKRDARHTATGCTPRPNGASATRRPAANTPKTARNPQKKCASTASREGSRSPPAHILQMPPQASRAPPKRGERHTSALCPSSKINPAPRPARSPPRLPQPRPRNRKKAPPPRANGRRRGRMVSPRKGSAADYLSTLRACAPCFTM